MIIYSDGTKSDRLPVTAERAAMIISINSSPKKYDFSGYTYLLPPIPVINGSLDLSGYNHPLPEGLLYIQGSVSLENYTHPLPTSLVAISGWTNLSQYQHPLPTNLKRLGSAINLDNYNHPLPPWLLVSGKDNVDIWWTARYFASEWRIVAGGCDMTVSAALANFRHENTRIFLIKKLIEQIEQSPLK